MARVIIKTETIQDWATFHEEFKQAMDFPDFYGANMNAWIDCLSYLYDGDGMSRFDLAPDEMLQIEIQASEEFKSRLPEIFEALIDSTAFVNMRYTDRGESPALSLVFT
jgi:barstar (barnase inhibitor)